MKLLFLLLILMMVGGNAFSGTGYHCPRVKETVGTYGMREKIMRTQICVANKDFIWTENLPDKSNYDYKIHGYVVVYNEEYYPPCPIGFRGATFEESAFFESTPLEDKFLEDVCKKKKWFWQK